MITKSNSNTNIYNKEDITAYTIHFAKVSLFESMKITTITTKLAIINPKKNILFDLGSENANFRVFGYFFSKFLKMYSS